VNGEGERWLGPGEAAARLGVTAKALRVYERAGLVRPERTAGQWRAYGPAHIARLHMILVMRELGMSLKDIGQALDGKGVSLSVLLAAQQDALEQKRRKIVDAIEHVRVARLRIAQGLPLATDDFLQLSKETVMQDATMSPDVKAGLTAHLQSAVPSEHYDAVKTAVGTKIAEAGLDNLKAEAGVLIAEMKRLAEEGDPNSPAARAAIERWRTVIAGLPQPNPEARKAWHEGWDKAAADPAVGPNLPLDQKTVSFMRDVVANMRASGERA
jgi:MerR family transcriptional regulator, thiopeptide resistance regulator